MQNHNEQPTVGGIGGGVAIETPVRDRGESLSENVIEAVAETTGEDAMDMRPLYEVVDPDALDTLFDATPDGTQRADDGHVSFRFNGCDVTVYADGQVEVSKHANRAP